MAKRTNRPKKKAPEGKEEGNSYDKIFKENLRELIPSLIRSVLGYKDFRLEALPQVRLQTTLEKEPDFLMKIFDERSPDGRILHFEFEGQDLDSMDWRMEEYLAIGGKIYRMEIQQELFYLGNGRPKNINGEIKHTHFTYCYPVHSIGLISYKKFLFGESPQETVFAILADPEDLDPDELIRMIIERLIQLAGDAMATKKFVNQLVMLSRKRNLRAKTVKIINTIMDYQAYEDDILYINGLEKGIVKGIEKGIVKGEEIGKEEKDIIAIRNMSKKGFDASVIAGLLEISIEYVKGIKEQLAKEPKIIALLRKKKADIKKIAKQMEVNPLLVRVIQDHLEK